MSFVNFFFYSECSWNIKNEQFFVRTTQIFSRTTMLRNPPIVTRFSEWKVTISNKIFALLLVKVMALWQCTLNLTVAYVCVLEHLYFCFVSVLRIVEPSVSHLQQQLRKNCSAMYANSHMETDDDCELIDDIVERPNEKWDCESIISTINICNFAILNWLIVRPSFIFRYIL